MLVEAELWAVVNGEFHGGGKDLRYALMEELSVQSWETTKWKNSLGYRVSQVIIPKQFGFLIPFKKENKDNIWRKRKKAVR